jgi:hypothetical protein
MLCIPAALVKVADVPVSLETASSATLLTAKSGKRVERRVFGVLPRYNSQLPQSCPFCLPL